MKQDWYIRHTEAMEEEAEQEGWQGLWLILLLSPLVWWLLSVCVYGLGR